MLERFELTALGWLIQRAAAKQEGFKNWECRVAPFRNLVFSGLGKQRLKPEAIPHEIVHAEFQVVNTALTFAKAPPGKPGTFWQKPVVPHKLASGKEVLLPLPIHSHVKDRVEERLRRKNALPSLTYEILTAQLHNDLDVSTVRKMVVKGKRVSTTYDQQLIIHVALDFLAQKHFPYVLAELLDALIRTGCSPMVIYYLFQVADKSPQRSPALAYEESQLTVLFEEASKQGKYDDIKLFRSLPSSAYLR